MIIEKRIAELGLTLPAVSQPLANFIPSVQVGDLLFLAGTVGRIDGQVRHPGRLGTDLSVEQGYAMARDCALNHLGVLKAALGDLDRVERVVKLTGWVKCTPDFLDLSKVINGASDLCVEVFGERGRHARASIGVSALALNAPVETELVVQVKAAGRAKPPAGARARVRRPARAPKAAKRGGRGRASR